MFYWGTAHLKVSTADSIACHKNKNCQNIQGKYNLGPQLQHCALNNCLYRVDICDKTALCIDFTGLTHAIREVFVFPVEKIMSERNGLENTQLNLANNLNVSKHCNNDFCFMLVLVSLTIITYYYQSEMTMT